jgi:Mn-dependent DtxR family transcriptional regulator
MPHLDPDVCRALAHPLTFDIYKLLVRWTGPPPSTTHLAKHLSVEVYEVSRCLGRLSKAGLVTYQSCGRLHHWQAIPLRKDPSR